MFHSRRLNNKIDHIHERALSITYNHKSLSYGELLTKDSSLTIATAQKHKNFDNRNLQSHTGNFPVTFE